jgi:hypothetical protein
VSASFHLAVTNNDLALNFQQSSLWPEVAMDRIYEHRN